MRDVEPHKTYLWLSGHVRNVGDSMLRRPLADLYRGVGPISVWTAAPSSGYEAGLRLQEGESAGSFFVWVRSYARAVLRGRPTFVFNAGEFGVTKAYFFGLLMLGPLLVLARLRGGRIVWVGAGVKVRRRFFMWPFDLLARSAAELRWRDVQSPRLMRRGTVMPDWGFGIGPGGDERKARAVEGEILPREYVAVSLRGDRSTPSAEWLDAVVRLAKRVDRKLLFIVQVQDDNRLATELAERLGAEVISWGSGDHWRQEQVVRSAYSRSVLVLSDRLHGLVIAATEGCVPLGWCEATTSKVANHFDVLTAEWVAPRGARPVELIDALDEASITVLAERTRRAVAEAYVAVDQVRSDLLALTDSR